MEEPAAVTITTLLTSVGNVVTAAFGWVAKVAETIVAQPVLLLFCVGVPLCGLGVGMFRRLINSRG